MQDIDSAKKILTAEELTKMIRLGLAVIETEAQAIAKLAEAIDDDFALACHYLLHCKGRIVVIGMGKSGHIGSKIAATLASTGSPAFFVHPGEASHGDLGMIIPGDVVLALSNSGETGEILTILPLIKRLKVPLITLTGKPDSTMANIATVNIDVGVEQEACPLGLAPTSSSTAALVMGDALAVSLLEARGFTAEDFAYSHPGGVLGRRLLLKLDDIMHTGSAIPSVQVNAQLRDAVVEMTQKGLGMTAVLGEDQTLLGILTDGDLRRTLDRGLDCHSTPIADVFTANCKTVQSGILAAEALQIMQEKRINALLVVDASQRVIGALNMHDLLRAGVM